ncbi:hypothetical protein O3P69_020043 [Scylla paramamosain]|uniref:Uncharacterized protein n=1 Tax=Scylla paramamosain TaxID=85552 RepID=A0AAW0TKD2_SCYPA
MTEHLRRETRGETSRPRLYHEGKVRTGVRAVRRVDFMQGTSDLSQLVVAARTEILISESARHTESLVTDTPFIFYRLPSSKLDRDSHHSAELRQTLDHPDENFVID